MRYILIFSFFLFILTLNLVSPITGEVITGEVTNTPLNMNISISGAPFLNLTSPRVNWNYWKINISLNYTSVNADIIRYNLDNGDNITITSPRIINLTNGTHTLRIYAENENGVTLKVATFNINAYIMNVSHERFSGGKKGNSTEFWKKSYEELQELPNITLEHTDHGRIFFGNQLNLTNDNNASDGLVDLDSWINISHNWIYLNSTALPNLNTSATLKFYNLTFSNPRILLDGSVCPSTICTISSYSNGILEFEVEHFSSYSSEETSSSDSNSGSSSGGGGSCSYKWDCGDWGSCLPEKLKKRSCVNLGTCSSSYQPPETEIDCEYSNSGQTIFDLIISTLPKDREIYSDSKSVSFRMNLIKFGEQTNERINLHYKIYNEEEIIVEKEETLMMTENEISQVKKIEIPKTLKTGVYQIDTTLEYNDGVTAEAKTSFKVIEREFPLTSFEKYGIYLGIGIILILLVIILILIKNNKSLNYKKTKKR